MRKVLAIAVLVLLVGAACSDDDGGSSDESTAADAAPPSTESTSDSIGNEGTTTTVATVEELSVDQATLVIRTCFVGLSPYPTTEAQVEDWPLQQLAFGASGVAELEDWANTVLEADAEGDERTIELSHLEFLEPFCTTTVECVRQQLEEPICPTPEEVVASWGS